MDKDIIAYIIENDMFKTGDCIIAAVSGGADSMCMLFCLSELAKDMSLSIHVLHVNHGIRGAEADDDEAFVKDFCEKNSIPFTSVAEDVPAIAAKQGKTLEEAGREIRYNALFDAARKYNAASVALAHNQNDRAETVLLNLLRGSGVTGSAGIRPVTYRNNIKLIRPLLSTSRSRIEEILAAAQIPYRTDSTNFSNKHTRNRLRTILPILSQQINERSVEHLCFFAEDMAEAADFISLTSNDMLKKALNTGSAILVPAKASGLAENILSETAGEAVFSPLIRKASVKVSFLEELHPAVRAGFMRLLLSKITSSLKDISRTHINSIANLMSAETSKTVSLPYGLFAMRTKDSVLISVKDEGERPSAESFFSCKKYRGDERDRARSLIERDLTDPSSNKNCTKWFDYDIICDNLEFRYPQAKDTMVVRIGGRLCHKEIAKIFREAGITARQYGNIPVAVCSQEVIWIPGIRRCDDFPVTPDTKTILEITCCFGK